MMTALTAAPLCAFGLARLAIAGPLRPAAALNPTRPAIGGAVTSTKPIRR